MLATLSFRIIELADTRTGCSFRILLVMLGNGRISRDHTSDRRFSSLIRSPRAGASTGIRLVVSRDCDLLIDADVVECGTSLKELVFLMMTWHRAVAGPTVVALWIEIRLATVPGVILARFVSAVEIKQ